jgi:hypothetical protein
MAAGHVKQQPGSTRALVALLAFVLGFATVPHRVMERDAATWFSGAPSKADGLALGVAEWTAKDLAPASFATGSSRFDSEWHFSTYMMGAMGFGQMALERPDVRDVAIARMERCLDALLDPHMSTFDSAAWGGPALASDRGHVGFLGYAGLAYALHRELVTSARYDTAEQNIIDALVRRILASPAGFVETYPNEVYPVDNASALAALAVHAHATKTPPSPALARGLRAIRERGIDPATGLLVQAVAPNDGAPRDAPRASGTALASYFLSFADAELSRSLFRALGKQFRTVIGFGGMMEYPAGFRRRPGDIDSGPVFLGFGVSASGFALGASRAHGDREKFTALYATAQLFGAPLDENGTRTYATGGPIGDAILFAMLTALRAGRFTG